MSADRLKVRDASGDGYEVLDYDGEPIAICATIVDAARFVHGRAARFWLDWDRTVISGPPAPGDFCASFLGSDSIGRIRAERHGASAGSWFWSISTHDDRWRKHGGQRGREPSKDLAVAALEREFTRYLADTPPGPSPYALAKGL
ncbi:hypothetical protein EN932_26715 [Mesorhizobium sp. M7A.F.Ca.US.002.01.1.1]|uniref:hypothetical protein n=1 Tax=Mesorhizobium sp. M7A.F.Ca.US.002.01.1.1 TaxID=2496700 RepID=UPI000FD3F8D5|nr:hypothetical protein [Mesorhizobium sp. M7A.F.Ca.US.002.01.1.1]RVA07924.1 hypothetical protein EN932_26715 [Mesorhizobium sp. M7A.F.Ca.US.002.01.1.1]